MPEYVWMCLYKQGSEYTFGPKYAKIRNKAEFWIWHGSQYVSIIQHYGCTQNMPWQASEYILGSKYARIVNVLGFWICKSYTGL